MSWLLERLRKSKDNRGIMANLRCILVESKKHRAWPALNRLGVRIDDDISAYIAGLYAMHPEESSQGNFGATCKRIEEKRKEKRSNDSKLTPTERRFQHLLSAERSELMGRVYRMVLMAKSNSIAVNYGKLAIDIKYWGDQKKSEWASAFWAQSSESSEEDGK